MTFLKLFRRYNSNLSVYNHNLNILIISILSDRKVLNETMTSILNKLLCCIVSKSSMEARFMCLVFCNSKILWRFVQISILNEKLKSYLWKVQQLQCILMHYEKAVILYIFIYIKSNNRRKKKNTLNSLNYVGGNIVLGTVPAFKSQNIYLILLLMTIPAFGFVFDFHWSRN